MEEAKSLVMSKDVRDETEKEKEVLPCYAAEGRQGYSAPLGYLLGTVHGKGTEQSRIYNKDAKEGKTST